MSDLGPIVIVTGDFVPTGGMDRANFALASFLARSGQSVRLVSHRVDESLAALPGVTVIQARKPLGSYALGEWCLSWAGRRAARAALAAGGRVVVNGGNSPVADVNWVHYVHAAHQPTMTATPLRRIKAAIQRPIDLLRERVALRRARVVIANSERTRRDVIERIGVPADRVRVVYYGNDPAQFRPATPAERGRVRERMGWTENRPVVLFIGGLGDRRKGFDTLFAAWIELHRRGWDGLLGVIGRGSELPLWERRAKELGLENQIQFLGFRSDVPDLLRGADALVSPTRYEAYGLGVHEALCCGLPALVSTNAGVAERYPPELADLLLPDPEDSRDLTTRLGRWRDDIASYATRVRPLADALRSHSWDDMGRRILGVI